MARASDYKIVSYYHTRAPNVEKFQIIYGGKPYGVYKTIIEAENIVRMLVNDPWFFDRGYTKKDRCNSQ
jgi:hypothetical protein